MTKGEPQYQERIARTIAQGPERLGLMTSWAYLEDPKRIAFTVARYKFVAKMLAGFGRVLEVGCGDAFATRIVLQAVKELVAIDRDPAFVADALERMRPEWPYEIRAHDLRDSPVEGWFDAVYALDVLEHVDPDLEDAFLRNMIAGLGSAGVAILGLPSIQSQTFAASDSGHVNCKDQAALGVTMRRYFGNVFLFSMNDEVIHTGFGPMSQYNIALCVGPR